MKFIRIFLLVLIIIGIGLLCTQKFWVPGLVNKILQFQGVSTAEKTIPTIVTNTGQVQQGFGVASCHENSKYFVVEKNLTGDVGTNHLIKYKTNENQSYSCEYIVEKGDFEIKNEWAEYFLALENNLLILDSGTSPDPRGLIIYDLSNRKKVYEDEYFSQSVKIQNNTIDYWRPTDIKVTAKNCPNLSEFEKNGIDEGIDSHVILNLSDFSLRELGEYRCTGRQ